MRAWIIAAIVASGFVPAGAQAQRCESVGAPTAGTTTTAQIVVMHRQGHILYASGPLQYTPPPRIPGGGWGPATWNTPAGSPAQQIFSDAPGPSAPRGLAVVARPVSVQVMMFVHNSIRRQNISVRLTISGVGLPIPVPAHSFEATCSPNGILRGSDGPRDFLITLVRRP